MRRFALPLAALALAASSPAAEAATVIPYGGVGQHATVMNNIARAQQRNNAAINRVQSNSRAAQRRRY